LSLVARYVDLMTKTPPTKPPLPPLFERLKLSDRFVDVTDQHVGEVFVLTGYGSAGWRSRQPIYRWQEIK
jgi:hypothetical protein